MRSTSFSVTRMSAFTRREAYNVVLKLCSTHFGSPVVPEVNAMRKIASGSMCTRCFAAMGGESACNS